MGPTHSDERGGGEAKPRDDDGLFPSRVVGQHGERIKKDEDGEIEGAQKHPGLHGGEVEVGHDQRQDGNEHVRESVALSVRRGDER